VLPQHAPVLVAKNTAQTQPPPHKPGLLASIKRGKWG